MKNITLHLCSKQTRSKVSLALRTVPKSQIEFKKKNHLCGDNPPFLTF